MPRPPPPADAFTSTGQPRAATAFFTPRSTPSAPVGISTVGRTGTPAPAMVALAASFDPMASITSGGGPTKTSPAATQARAKAASSDRNP